MGEINIGHTVIEGKTQEMNAYCEGREDAANGYVYAHAKGTTGVEGNNNGITWTCLIAGDGLVVNLIDPGANDATLRGEYKDRALDIYLATNAGGAITTTASTVIAAVNAEPYAQAVVRASNTGASTGAGVVVAESATLTGADATPKHEADPRGADLWARGHASWTDDPANAPTPRDRCSHAYGGGYTP